MVKHSPVRHGPILYSERFGRPQVLAACLLLAFLAQCLWLVEKGVRPGRWIPRRFTGLSAGPRFGTAWARAQRGCAQVPPELGEEDSANEMDPALRLAFEDGGYDAHHSPLWYLIAAAPLWLRPVALQPENIRALHWSAAVPYLGFGLLLGASLWYVARRLFGNAGGYVALALYCFSPGIVRSCALWFAEPEVGAAWGAFGAIFTAIAVAHTLYAPREVVLWNWRRIMLLGLSLALAVGSQFSLIIVVPVALAFMLYLAPTRRLAALAIWAVACGIAVSSSMRLTFFGRALSGRGFCTRRFSESRGRRTPCRRHIRQVLEQLGQSSPALVLALPVALVAYFCWPRARYFGNTAPLLVAASFLALAVGTPHYPGLGFQFMAVPFLFVFVAGIAADLLETRHRQVVMAAVWGLLVANAAWSLWELARVA